MCTYFGSGLQTRPLAHSVEIICIISLHCIRIEHSLDALLFVLFRKIALRSRRTTLFLVSFCVLIKLENDMRWQPATGRLQLNQCTVNPCTSSQALETQFQQCRAFVLDVMRSDISAKLLSEQIHDAFGIRFYRWNKRLESILPLHYRSIS